jgi:hypothetical protein
MDQDIDRAERAVIIHEMTTEEARNTEVNITSTEEGEDMETHTSCVILTTDWWTLSWK